LLFWGKKNTGKKRLHLSEVKDEKPKIDQSDGKSNASSWPKLRFTNVQDGGVPHMLMATGSGKQLHHGTIDTWIPLPCKFMNRYPLVN